MNLCKSLLVAVYTSQYIHMVQLCICAAKDADEKEKWIFALENAISRQEFNHVCSLWLIIVSSGAIIYDFYRTGFSVYLFEVLRDCVSNIALESWGCKFCLFLTVCAFFLWVALEQSPYDERVKFWNTISRSWCIFEASNRPGQGMHDNVDNVDCELALAVFYWFL